MLEDVVGEEGSLDYEILGHVNFSGLYYEITEVYWKNTNKKFMAMYFQKIIFNDWVEGR